jgi:oxygen-independent coproporphyrinogen-3 oxidase
MDNWIGFVEQNPHEFTIQYPPRREYFKEFFREKIPKEGLLYPKTLLLYLHIPFCEAKCYYCNFAVDVRNRKDVFIKYTEALCRELDRYKFMIDEGYTFSGIDIGGGTPSLLSPELLEKLLICLDPFVKSSSHPFPLSIETTPNIAAQNPDLLKLMVTGSIDRISMGIQSFNVEKLKDVNRSLQIQKNELATQNIRNAGFKRFNADLIFGLPYQSLNDWEFSIDRIIELAPDSITTYDCLYRGKGRALTRKTEVFPTLETYGQMYDLAYHKLLNAGYFAPYGSVNFSKVANETGTSAYFEGRLLNGTSYIGLGNYASSQTDNFWFFNTFGVDNYIQKIFDNDSPIGDFYHLPKEELYAKYILYSLNYGIVDSERFQKRFGVDFWKTFEKEIHFAITKKWLLRDSNQLGLNVGNFKNMNFVRSLFYSSKAKTWLKQLIDK